MVHWPDFKEDVLSTYFGLQGESDPVKYQQIVDTLPLDLRVAGPSGPLYVTEASMYVRYLRTVLMPLDEVFMEDLPAASEAGRLPEWADANEPTIEQTKALLDDTEAPQEAGFVKELFLHSLSACSLAATLWQLSRVENGTEYGQIAVVYWRLAIAELERVETVIQGQGLDDAQ